MSPKADHYVALSEQYWEHSKKLISEEDWPQASEKLWGCAAELVKALAEERGWPHDGHSTLFKIIGRLAQETGLKELQKFFADASALHINFYEGWLTPEQVRALGDEVSVLRDHLRRLLGLAA